MNRRLTPTILLMDSREDVRTVYADALRAIGFDVANLHEHERTIERVLAINPRVIAIGADPATRDAWVEFCRAMKADERTARIPTLLLESDDATRHDVGLATDPGVLVLNVPLRDGAKLVAAISGVLAAQRAEPLQALLRRRRTDTGQSA